jgi:hypothetical protein
MTGETPFLVCKSHPPGDFLLMLRLHQLQIVMMMPPFCLFHPALLWFCVIVMMRFLFRGLCSLVPPLLLFVHPHPVPQACGRG